MVKRSVGKKNTGRLRKGWLLILSLLIVALVVPLWLIFFEGKKPVASFDNIPSSVGRNTEIEFSITDDGRGLKDIHLYLYKDKRELVLVDKVFESAGFFSGTEKKEYTVKLKINPEELGIEDGMASLRMIARDCSWRSFFKGNKIYLQKDIIIDTTPPNITVLSRNHYVSPGGAGVVCYKVSELDAKDGVVVGKEFFPGYSGMSLDPHYKVAFFALEHREENNPIFIEAVDKAGNIRKAGFPYYIRNKRYISDKLSISDNFLAWKMPEFNTPDVDDSDLLQKFLVVNNKIREENTKRLTSLAKNTESKKLWEGAFIQLPGSAKRANFADHRSYYYKGKKVDDAYHMGLDLASVTNANVPAANSGKVADVDRIGIYGLNVTIDHGFGLFSCYSHLSQADVKKGDFVKKGQIIGKTGTTGMAGGDHLHFGIFINNRFVDPIEWLDPNWVKNNIESKLSLISSYK